MNSISGKDNEMLVLNKVLQTFQKPNILGGKCFLLSTQPKVITRNILKFPNLVYF